MTARVPEWGSGLVTELWGQAGSEIREKIVGAANCSIDWSTKLRGDAAGTARLPCEDADYRVKHSAR
jgi:hypothetical protein